MDSRYIQLPPLPSDMPTECIEMIWLYTRLSKQEQEMIREFVKENLKEENKKLDETGFAKMLRESEKINPDIREYTDLMKKLLGLLIVQSCGVAALVYQNYCIKGKSIDDISKEFNVDKESIQLMVQYYDKKTES